MRLNELHDLPGSSKTRKRVGRGIGSGKGKTAGRGVKGQKSRSGVAIKGFEGGQMPIHMRMPKRGFNNPLRKTYAETNLGKLQEAIDAGKLDAGSLINAEALAKAGVVRRVKDGVRLLSQGDLRTAVQLELAGASENARKAVEKAGGSIKLLKVRHDPEAPGKTVKAAAKRKPKQSGGGD